MRQTIVTLAAVVAGAALVALAVLLAALFTALSGYILGVLLWKVFPFAGEWVTRGFALIGVELAVDQLRYLGAALGFVGSFFKPSQPSSK